MRQYRTQFAGYPDCDLKDVGLIAGQGGNRLLVPLGKVDEAQHFVFWSTSVWLRWHVRFCWTINLVAISRRNEYG